MKNITMTNTTQMTRALFAFPQVADRSLTVGVRGAFQGTGLSAFGYGDNDGFAAIGGLGADLWISAVTPVPTFLAPTHKAFAVKDVAYLRSWSPPV